MQVRFNGFPPVQWLLSNRRSLWIRCSLFRILIYAALASAFFWMWLCLEPPFSLRTILYLWRWLRHAGISQVGLMVPIS